MTTKQFAVDFDKHDINLDHRGISSVNVNLHGLILLYDRRTIEGRNVMNRLYWGFGNIREELRKASQTPAINSIPFVYFSYKAEAEAEMFESAKKHLPTNQ